MHEYYFERMNVWQNARELTIIIYSITKSFPDDENYHLTGQMRRSASSVKSIIAEGQGRKSTKDQIHFTNMAYSSLIELLNHLITAMDLNLIEQKLYKDVRERIELISNQLNKLKSAQELRLSSPQKTK